MESRWAIRRWERWSEGGRREQQGHGPFGLLGIVLLIHHLHVEEAIAQLLDGEALIVVRGIALHIARLAAAHSLPLEPLARIASLLSHRRARWRFLRHISEGYREECLAA